MGGVVPASVLPRGVRVEPYLSDRIALVCAPDDPVWSMGPISASHLQSLRFVSINRNSSGECVSHAMDDVSVSRLQSLR